MKAEPTIPAPTHPGHAQRDRYHRGTNNITEIAATNAATIPDKAQTILEDAKARNQVPSRKQEAGYLRHSTHTQPRTKRKKKRGYVVTFNELTSD